MENRKTDHIALASLSQTSVTEIDNRFYYEPLLAIPPHKVLKPFEFAGKIMKAPIWISSMTGGTTLAGKINRNLAKACNEFGLGMGLGSCRALLENMKHFDDFNVREIIGEEQPLYANLGIAQIEQLIERDEITKITELISNLRADGLIVHINPMQEGLQPEGDSLNSTPLEILKILLQKVKTNIIVKEVGQGFGIRSLAELLQLPIKAIEFGAFGGTNFAKLELLRNNDIEAKLFEPLSKIGHGAAEMISMLKNIIDLQQPPIKCNELIISGGINSFLDGFYYMKKSPFKSVYGQASAFLMYAKNNYEELQQYIKYQIKGLQMAYSCLSIKN